MKQPGPDKVIPFAPLEYPDSDGEPMADNDANAHRMIDTWSACREAFRQRGEPAYVSRDLFVYPVEGEPWTRCAPDLLVAPGCPPGTRPSFKYWEEAGPVALAGEFLSVPRSETIECPAVAERIAFYRREMATTELFVYQPLGLQFEDGFRFRFLRRGPDDRFHPVEPGPGGWYQSSVLPLELRPTNHRVEIRDGETGVAYLSDVERAEQETRRAEQEARRAEQEARRAEQEARRAEQEARRAEQEARRADRAEERLRELEARLRRRGADEEE